MDEDLKNRISRLYVEQPNIKLLDASRIVGVPPTKIYNHLARVQHNNKPCLSQKEYSILLEREKNQYATNNGIATSLGFKTQDVKHILLKHGYSGGLVVDSPKQAGLKEIIRKIYNADPAFPEKDLCMYVDQDIKPREIRTALVAVKSELNQQKSNSPVVTFKIASEARRKAIATYLIRHPNATYSEIGKKFKVSTITVSEDIRALSSQFRVQQTEAYELQRHRMSVELATVKKKAMDRFDASTKSSSRFLEIYLSAMEKEAKLHGLNAPERKQVQIDSTVQSKEDRDAVVEAYCTVNDHDKTSSSHEDLLIGVGYDDVSAEQ